MREYLVLDGVGSGRVKNNNNHNKMIICERVGGSGICIVYDDMCTQKRDRYWTKRSRTFICKYRRDMTFVKNKKYP